MRIRGGWGRLLLAAALVMGCEDPGGGGGDADTDADSDADSDSDSDTDTGPGTREYQFRSISGFSMGGVSAAFLGLRHPEKWDIIAPLGTAMDSVMFVNNLRAGFGGFCVPPELGKMCPGEDGGDYEHLDTGGPMAGGFDREAFVETAQDGIIAYGNAFLYNPDDPYLPPGVPRSYLDLTDEQKCSQPVVVDGYFDRRYSPDGAYPAITFCDGGESEPGIFDENATQTAPMEVTLAIDLNGNGRRDSGEPILMQDQEPYSDTGPDGLFSADEAGYDAATNPDPAGDDWDLWNNPMGTEGDGRWQEGEAYEDVGLDGVAGNGAHDYGEGNGQYDRTPAALKYDRYDPRLLAQQVDLSRFDFYLDVGLRDHLGFREMTEHFASTLRALGRDVGVYHQFRSLYDVRNTYDPMKADFTGMARDILVIYGDPDATQEQIDGGDGGHVGSVPQMVNRLLTMVKFVSDRWPDGDREPVSGLPGRSDRSSYHSAAAGRDIDYLVFLPPGYDREGTTYPVLYLLHGLGMSPGDLQVADYLVDLYMSDGRLQKFIVIYPDAQCLPEECNDGNFYIDQAGGWVDGKDYETAFVDDLVAHVDATYKVRPPETFDVE